MPTPESLALEIGMDKRLGLSGDSFLALAAVVRRDPAAAARLRASTREAVLAEVAAELAAGRAAPGVRGDGGDGNGEDGEGVGGGGPGGGG